MFSATHGVQQGSSHQEKGINDPVEDNVHPQSSKKEDKKESILSLAGNVDSMKFVRTNSSGCSFPFVEIGSNCYYFSTETKNYYDSVSYCETLGYSHSIESTIAMLGYNEAEDEALLGEAVNQGKNFWVGGKRIEDTGFWEWEDGRTMNLYDPYWYYTEPNEAQNKCAVAQVTTSGNIVRSYLYDYDCSKSLSFICQTFNFEFIRIGNNYYFFSEEAGLPHTSWTNARDYCRSLSTPIGYHSDLAVLGLEGQDSYNLMDIFTAITDYGVMWLGAYAPTDCDFQWVDGRPLESSSHYWLYNQPSCGSYTHVALEHNSNNRTYIGDLSDANSIPFICQLFKN